MVLEFYYDNLSQPCRAVYILLKAAGVDFSAKEMELLKGDHYKEEFVKKNPYHKVPVIDDDGFILAESIAIMRYVANKCNIPDHWYPKIDVQKQARVDEFLHWHHLSLRKSAIQLIPSLELPPSFGITYEEHRAGEFCVQYRARLGFGIRFPKQAYDPALKSRCREELTKAIQHIEAYFLQDKPFIAGDEISVADLIGVMELIQLQMVEQEDLYTGNKRVTDWIQRVRERTQPHYDDATVKVEGARKAYIAAEKDEAK